MAPPRVPTHVGDRNEDRSVKLKAPRGVGLTEPPVMAIAAAALEAKPIVPRNEFDFESGTPVAMDPDTYHALQTFRAEVLNAAKDILGLVKTEVDTREARELVRAERRGKWMIAMVTAAGVAIAGIIAAALHGCT